MSADHLVCSVWVKQLPAEPVCIGFPQNCACTKIQLIQTDQQPLMSLKTILMTTCGCEFPKIIWLIMFGDNFIQIQYLFMTALYDLGVVLFNRHWAFGGGKVSSPLEWEKILHINNSKHSDSVYLASCDKTWCMLLCISQVKTCDGKHFAFLFGHKPSSISVFLLESCKLENWSLLKRLLKDSISYLPATQKSVGAFYEDTNRGI